MVQEYLNCESKAHSLPVQNRMFAHTTGQETVAIVLHSYHIMYYIPIENIPVI